MDILPSEIEDIILDYKYQLEHVDRYSRTIDILNYIKKIKKCNLCNLINPSRLVLHIIKRLNHKPNDITNSTIRYCFYRDHIY